MGTARLYGVSSVDKTSLRFISRTTWDTACSCGTSASCQRAEGFYCRTTSCTSSTPNQSQTIPGLYARCLLVDSLLASSLECFYNKSCIQMLYDWQLFGFVNLTIYVPVMNMTPLDPMIDSRFSRYTTMDKVVPLLFIDGWENTTNFTAYYNQCAPEICTYRYEERFDTVYVVTTLLGIVGGLSTALRIFALPLVKLLRRIYRYCQRTRRQYVREGFQETSKP